MFDPCAGNMMMSKYLSSKGYNAISRDLFYEMNLITSGLLFTLCVYAIAAASNQPLGTLLPINTSRK